MLLKVNDRACILGLLPETGGIDTARTIMKLREECWLSAEEGANIELVTTQLPDGKQQMRWNEGKDVGTEININGIADAIIKSKLATIPAEQVTVSILSFAETFGMGDKFMSDTLKKLDLAEQIRPEHIPYWDKYVGKCEESE